MKPVSRYQKVPPKPMNATESKAEATDIAPSSNWLEAKELSDEIFSFTADLRNVLKASQPLNLIYSPLSIRVLAAMTKLGARERTGKEIQKRFYFPADDAVLMKAYSHIYTHMNTNGYTFVAANQLYAHQSIQIRKDYAKLIKDTFGAHIVFLDFTKPLAAADTINNWVEKTTRGKVKGILRPGDTTANDRLVLISGINFQGFFIFPFDRQKTQIMSFYVNKSKMVDVSMMYTVARFPWALIKSVNAQAVVLPFIGNKLGMLIFVPLTKIGLMEIEKNLKNFSLPQIVASLVVKDVVHPYLPKLKMDSTLKLIEPLANLGMATMFNPNAADFSGMSSTDPIVVSQVIQKTVLEVSEKGCVESPIPSESGESSGRRSNPNIFNSTLANDENSQHVTIKMDKPFLFQIVDLYTNVVYVSGCCRDPSL